jgi:hypothetical protein
MMPVLEPWQRDRRMEEMKMPLIKMFDFCNYKTLLGILIQASQKAAKAYGLEIELVGSPHVSRADLTFRLCATAPGVAKADYLEFAEDRGLPKTGLGKTFRHGRYVYKIAGLKPNSKYEVVTTRGDGARCDWRLADVAKVLKSQETK